MQDLESSSGQSLPTWLEEIITPAGYLQYARVAEQVGHVEQARAARVLADHMNLQNLEVQTGTPQNEERNLTSCTI